MYVIRRQIISECLKRLREQKTHTFFVGYICLQQRACLLGRLDDLRPDFLSFFKRFFSVENHPLGTPYIKIFTDQKASPKNLWLNENIAGSYAPSSLRPNQPFRKVIRMDGKKYILPSDHARRALDNLLFENPVQVADLAVFLYRDFGLISEKIKITDVIDMFAYEFGYTDVYGETPNKNFELLYSLETTRNWEKNWLEQI